MCGRARLSSDVSEIKIAFGMPPERPTPYFAASWNVAPTDPLPIVRYDAKDHRRSLQVMRWGLVPFWVKDIKAGFANINAKTEGVWGFLPNPPHAVRRMRGDMPSPRSCRVIPGKHRFLQRFRISSVRRARHDPEGASASPDGRGGGKKEHIGPKI
jgi:hypothetical protein